MRRPLCRSEAPGWAPLAVQYVDYTLWQREQLGELDAPDSEVSDQLTYWTEALAGIPDHIDLPTDRPYPAVADLQGATIEVDWPAELQQQIARVAREHNATSFMVVQAALAVMLAKLSASSDVAIGFPIAGRRDPPSTTWWASSSTPWCCVSIWPETPLSKSFWRKCGPAAWRPTSTRTCRSRYWSSA